MNLIKFECPYCGHQLQIAANLTGRDMDCPACKRTFTVPKSGASAFVPPQPPPLPTSNSCTPLHLDNTALIQIRKTLGLKQTEELVAIWTENDRGTWRKEAFVAVADILRERGVPPPEQKPFDTAEWSRKTLKHRAESNEIAAFILVIPQVLLVALAATVAGGAIGCGLYFVGLTKIGVMTLAFGVPGFVLSYWYKLAMGRLKRLQEKEREKMAEQSSRGDFC